MSRRPWKTLSDIPPEQCPVCGGLVTTKCSECMNPCRWCAQGHCWCACLQHPAKQVLLTPPLRHCIQGHTAVVDWLCRECTCAHVQNKDELTREDLHQFYDALVEFRRLSTEVIQMLRPLVVIDLEQEAEEEKDEKK